MEKTFILDQASLKRLPHLFVFIIILLLGLPYIGINFGMDWNSVSNQFYYNTNFHSQIMESEIRGYFRQSLLQWTGFALAAITVLLAFTQYKLNNDKIALIIGLSFLFSGSVSALYTLTVDGLSLSYKLKVNLDAMIWVFSNALSGIILFSGLILVLLQKNKSALSAHALILLSFFIILSAVATIFYATGVIQVPEMLFKDFYLNRPYELVSIVIYLSLVLFILPKAYKAYPTVLTDGIFYMAITEIVLSFYLMIMSHAPYDSAFNIAYFLKLVTYLIPCACFILNYVSSYSAVLNTQKRLRIKQDELKYIASHDSLTNLFNRREFEELLDKTIANTIRYKSPLALLLIDMDNFKAINDTFGHNHGDELLKQFSQRLLKIVRTGDILSRVGGDEFTLILPNIESPTAARKVADKVLNQLNTPYEINSTLITVTVSIGISVCPLDGNTTEELLRKADLAMYKAKNSGKNSYQYYTDILSSLQHHEAEIEAHLRQALKNDEFELYYQPKFNLLTQQIIGAEVLLRWSNPTLGNVPPSEFIPVAERTGLIIDLGYWLMRKACKQIMDWSKQHQTMLSFSINISPLQLMHKDFLTYLQNCLKEYKYPANYLELEITENVLVNESKEMGRVLKNVSALGVKLSLDDFGKEYSSLNRLNTLPLDILKIDKSFIANIKNARDKVIIVDIIIKLASELNMIIIAEGIETNEQLNYLLSKKCFFGQGYLFSKPMQLDEFEQLAYKAKSSDKSSVTAAVYRTKEP